MFLNGHSILSLEMGLFMDRVSNNFANYCCKFYKLMFAVKVEKNWIIFIKNNSKNCKKYLR